MLHCSQTIQTTLCIYLHLQDFKESTLINNSINVQNFILLNPGSPALPVFLLLLVDSLCLSPKNRVEKAARKRGGQTEPHDALS